MTACGPDASYAACGEALSLGKQQEGPAAWQALRCSMVEMMGLEPTTSGVTGRRSNQLNYRAILKYMVCGKPACTRGRGRRTRTLGTRFWRPLLYRLSYRATLPSNVLLSHTVTRAVPSTL